MLAPLVRLMVANGVAYPQFAQALKGVFLQAARAELADAGHKLTDSAVSLLSGVHRKDVRAFAQAARTPGRARSLAAEVFTSWVHDEQWRGADGHPRILPRTGDSPSFEALSLSVSKDFHPRAVLDELLRLGVAELRDDQVALRASAFVPQRDFAEMTYFFGANVRDHVATGAANLTAAIGGRPPPFLEQSVFADGLNHASIEHLSRVARQLWSTAFDSMVSAATERHRLDRAAGDGTHRMRFGTYFHAEPVDAEPAHSAGSTT